MTSCVRVSTILIVLAVISNTMAFPQSGSNLDDFSEVNGFVFDGPIRTTTRDSTNIGFTETTTRATPAPVTPGSPDYENCISSCVPTSEYNPVCGSDNITYDNPGRLNCAVFCGKNIKTSSYGRCGADGLRG
ncbi:PREDICTED: uncharacterized protein LOC107070755 [Polistes dominula]|uniref:Uncharacterized protein LOC107070755 n=1 Tax=Polistes dominula TaxID=743375 RepID=A0ABM1IWY5_POLDO|nr:PREDICTED: uncharacterized protein LOC107070755 [Polistes dominula]